MEVPLTLQFSIALFTGMVAATFVPAVRRVIPRPVEVSMWIAFITCCVVGVASVRDTNARELSYSALWAVDQLVNTIGALILGGASGWVSANRFAIASWLVILAGADVLALMLLNSMRNAAPWRPRVRLREWMELPVPASAVPIHHRAVSNPLLDVNRRLAGATAVLGSAMVSHALGISGRLRGLVPAPDLPHRLASAGRDGSSSRLESLRDATAHLTFAARSWYVAAGEPAFSDMAKKARAAQRRLGQEALRRGEVIDIQALLNAQSIGWYGPLGPEPLPPLKGEDDAADPKRPDSLAS